MFKQAMREQRWWTFQHPADGVVLRERACTPDLCRIKQLAQQYRLTVTESSVKCIAGFLRGKALRATFDGQLRRASAGLPCGESPKTRRVLFTLVGPRLVSIDIVVPYTFRSSKTIRPFSFTDINRAVARLQGVAGTVGGVMTPEQPVHAKLLRLD